MLSQACQRGAPIKHNNIQARSACEANAIDLVNLLLELDDQEKKPKIVIPSEQLGRIPLDALAISDERSVSARLESLEQSVRYVTSTMQRMMTMTSSPKDPASMPATQQPSVPQAEAGISFVQGPVLPVPGPQAHSYAAAAATNPKQGLQAPRQVRERSVSPSQKRKHEEAVGDSGEGEGFRRQGRPRKTVQGASKVNVEGVGDYQPSLQYYVGNTPGKASSDVIKKVLEKCSEPLISDGQLVVEDIELLTQVENPRTKCWRIVVPYKYKNVMENPELYPDGWRYRKFFGSRKVQERAKHPRIEGSIVEAVMKEVEKDRLEVLEIQGKESSPDQVGPGHSE